MMPKTQAAKEKKKNWASLKWKTTYRIKENTANHVLEKSLVSITYNKFW